MFTFRPWGSTDIGNAAALAAAFTQTYRGRWVGNDEHDDVSFEIVDVRPGSYAPDQVNALVDSLADLFLRVPAQGLSIEAGSRLLFVGKVRTLATPDKETVDDRSIKRDAEFYIRAFQNYNFAHYAGIGSEVMDCQGPGPSVLSALIGLSRHYRKADGQLHAVPIGERLNALKADFHALVDSARRLPEFEYVGTSDRLDVEGDVEKKPTLLREIGVIYQFGKGDRPLPFSPSEVLKAMPKTLDVEGEQSSYKLYASMLSAMANWAKAFHGGKTARKAGDRETFTRKRLVAAEEVSELSFKLSRYDLLRDFGRVIGQGSMQRFRDIDSARPILLIDDEIYGMLTSPHGQGRSLDDPELEPIIRYLGRAIGSIGRDPKSLHVVPSDYVDAHLGLMQAEGLTKLLEADPAVAAVDLEGRPATLRSLDSYLAILIDPESRRDPCGPVRVQRLHSLLRHRFGRSASAAMSAAMRRPLPPLLAYSRKESSGYVQQCLNMGASAFVPKTRPYQLLFALSRALFDERRQHRAGEQASQFRILKTLKPHVAAKLLRRSGPSFVHGGMVLPSGEHIEDPRETRWIRNLPKADLHYHLGTAISCETIEALAMNTAGHFLHGAPGGAAADSGERGADPLLHRMADTLALTARLERMLVVDGAPRFARMDLLAAAAAAIASEKPLKNSPFGLGDAIVAHLVEPNDRCDAAHATAMLVAMMMSRPCGPAKKGEENFPLSGDLASYFEKLASLEKCTPPQQNQPLHFSSDDALPVEMSRAYKHFNRVACRWNGTCTKDEFDILAAAQASGFWSKLHEVILVRMDAANRRLRKCFDDALDMSDGDDAAFERAIKWLNLNSQSSYLSGARAQDEDKAGVMPSNLSLADYVAVPDGVGGRGLQLYLRGADLLGSSHLQYPENLWMAALSITLDNARENVIYSEVRCETTGFCKAGMGAHDATELLRHGFNLASLYVAGLKKPNDDRHKLPLVRTNILLAAKRHKTASEARAVVNLLEVYLERRAATGEAAPSRRDYFEIFRGTMPPWWRPCDVVGFDLSGDESRDKDWLKEVIVPLAARSSPVTIHAGEAANAESIWRAVYELNALRIGHGLRLNEDTALLGYCVREGICMEFCPNSNRYTNSLDPQRRRDLDNSHPVTPLRYEYPLLHYLAQGMEVTLGTDNRYLHRGGQQTLSSEYLTAAELVGGLTRWEVLQIVKAGFKNAFLDKAEVQSLIESVEEEIYRIIATDFE